MILSHILSLKKFVILSFGLVVIFWVFQALAQKPASAPILITSERMTLQNRDQRLIFEGTVHVQKEDFQMDADRMIVTFAPNAPGSAAPGTFSMTASNGTGSIPTQSRSVSTIHAYGHVKIVTGDRRAASQAAVYEQAKDKVTLTENPESWEKDYKVSGTKITIFLKEDRSLVEGSTSVLIQP